MLKESTEAILVYENYTHEPKYVLKEQEGCNTAESTALLQIHISEISKKIPQSKYYLKVPVKHQKQTSANEKVYRTSYARKHKQRINQGTS